MHKSKLGGFIIDCQTDDLDRAADFWGAALGMPVRELPPGEAALYKGLVDHQHGLDIEVQKVGHASRVHLDIETDDIEAEVRRLEELGARRIQAVQSWWVMEAPTGQRFCVVRATSAAFAERATQWPETRGRPPANVANPGSSGLLSQIGDILDIVHQLPNITP
jgi:catechol 2,3-dioxygenase-like lactoylglutathione lyase family enzyme